MKASKLLCLALGLTLCVTLASPAMAAVGAHSGADLEEAIRLTCGGKDADRLPTTQIPIMGGNLSSGDSPYIYDINSRVISEDTVLTLENVSQPDGPLNSGGTKGEGTDTSVSWGYINTRNVRLVAGIRVCLPTTYGGKICYQYEKADDEDPFDFSMTMGDLKFPYLREDGTFSGNSAGAILYSGDKVSFRLPFDRYPEGTMFELVVYSSVGDIFDSYGSDEYSGILSSSWTFCTGKLPEPDQDPIGIRLGDDYFMSDYGPSNTITFTNNTRERISGAYSLLVYYNGFFCDICNGGSSHAEHRDDVRACLYSVDLDLAPGESVDYTLFSSLGWVYDMTAYKYVWVEYDDAAERASYLNDSRLRADQTLEENDGVYLGYYGVSGAGGKSYLADYPYHITFEPLNHHK